MDKTKAINPSNKQNMVNAVIKYRDYLNQPSSMIDANVLNILKSNIAEWTIEFVLSEEG